MSEAAPQEPAPIDPVIVAQLKAKHGDALIGVTAADGNMLVFRRPMRAEYDRWFDKRRDKPTEAGRELSQACVVYPDVAALFVALDRQPALLMCSNGIVDAITELAGFDGVPAPKKL